MSVLSGMLTARRFRVVGDLPSHWRESFRDRLNDHAFQSLMEELGKEEKEGWVQVHNLLDTQFDDFNRWLYGDYLVFALRVDKRSCRGSSSLRLWKSNVSSGAVNTTPSAVHPKPRRP